MPSVDELPPLESAPAARKEPRRLTWATVLDSRWLPAGIIAFGILLRLVRYLADRSLWLDESLLTLNLLHRSYAELLEPLDFGQGAPTGFLMLQKLSIDLFGDAEWALRLFPLLAGILSLLLFFAVARRLLAARAVPLALLLFATVEPFVRYSAEAKQYGFDVAIALALFYVFLLVVGAGRLTPGRAAVLGLAGAVAVWLSYPAVFVLAGIALASAVAVARSRDRRGAAMLAAAAGSWAVSFLAVYLLSLGEVVALREGVSRAVAPGSRALVKNLYVTFSDPGLMPRTVVGLAAVLGLVGAVAIWRRRGELPVLAAAGTIGAALVAGYLGKYPVGQRFTLYLLPVALIFVVAGAVELFRRAERATALMFGVAFLALVMASPVARATVHLFSPPGVEDIKPILRAIDERWQPGDTLYVYGNSQYALRYYLECRDCSGVPRRLGRLWPATPSRGPAQSAPALVSDSPSLVIGRQGRGQLELYLGDLNELRGRERVWLLFAHSFPLTRHDLTEPLDRMAPRLECVEHGVAFACVHDFSNAPRTPLPSDASDAS